MLGNSPGDVGIKSCQPNLVLDAPKDNAMSQGASHYPISQLIGRIMSGSGHSRLQLVTSLGYRNIERGFRRLDPWIDHGEGFPRIIQQITAHYPLQADEIHAAVAATATLKRAEAAAAWIVSLKAEADTFRPYIHVEGETIRPSSICLFGVSGGDWNLIDVPRSIMDLPLDKQLAALSELMNGYLREYEGHCPFFGKVTGFRFVRLLDYFQFDKASQLKGRVNEPFRRGYCSVSLR
jgi:hypothetical protein